MGKKVKKKTKSGQKEKRGPPMSLKTSALQGATANNAETPGDVIAGVKDRGLCSHTDKGINLDKLSAKLGSPQSPKCEDCRGHVDGRAKKGKGKQGKKGGVKSKSETSSIWICLECGHFSCGGVGLPTIPQSHAVRHAKQNHHPLVVHYENHQLLWCFSCSKLISADKSDDSKHKEILNEIDKILKGQPVEGVTVDVEDVWFGSGSVSSAIKSDYSTSIGVDGKAAYSLRGLVNLGNTCFFNSIMQNLLAIDSFRDYFFKLDDSVGPLGASMRKFFLETSSETSSRSAINPRSLFGSLCMKAPQFKGYQQHDSHELLRCLLDGLSTEELSAIKHCDCQVASIVGPTFVDAIFGGRLSSIVNCLECGYSSTIYEPFLDLSLPVPTKKPPVRKAQPVTRGKKSKLPPKKSGKNASKNSKVQGDSASVQSISGNSSNEVSTAPHADELVLSWSDSGFSDSIDPSTIALDMGFTAEDLSAIQKPKNQQAVENIGDQSISSDSFTWLDYLDTDQVSPDTNAASEIDKISANQGFVNEDARQADTSLSLDLNNRARSTSVNVVLASSLNDAKCSNSLLPLLSTEQVICQVDDKQHVKPLRHETVSADHSVHEEAQFDADLGRSSESCKQECFRDSSSSVLDNEQSSQTLKVEPQSNEALTTESSFIEDVQQGVEFGCVFDSCKQVSSGDSYTIGRDIGPISETQDSDFRLLPSKEVASSSGEVLGTETEASALILGDEQDSIGFDGFGDLFNEPESSVEHKSVAHSVSEGNDARSGNIGPSSESDPDEVDNANAPVSVESCLALFTKPEFLSKDEHAWQCDNCTKVLQEQRIRATRKIEIPESDVAPSGCEDGISCGLMDVNILNNVRSTNGNLEIEDVSDGISLAKNRNSRENGKCVLGKQPVSEISESSEPQMRNASSGSVEHESSSNENLNPCYGEQHPSRHEPAESNLDSTKSEAGGSEHEEVDSENVKVKRDATKSILINKSPPILTIHLKRFTQDARGRLSKLNGHVKFREIIDLKPYVDPRCCDSDKFTYHLVGVVEHSGSMRGGHYVAYVRGTKNLGNSIWYHASDAYVREASLEEVLRSEAYILFYERTSE